MDEAVKAHILSDIPRSKPITVTALRADGEACQFAGGIHAFLTNNSCPAAEDGIDLVVPSGTVKALTLNSDRSEFDVRANIR
jgi:hypothetical protein